MPLNEQLNDLFTLSTKGLHQTQTTQVPGKLFLVGEYAILEPQQLAVLIAVDQYLTGKLIMSSKIGEGIFQSSLEGLEDLVYNRNPQTQEIQAKYDAHTTADHIRQWQYVIAAVHTVEAVLDAMGRTILDYHFEFSTELVSAEGEKYGLGSSGAITAATIQTLLKFYGLVPKDPLTIYKLTALALLQTQSRGSMADIAASIYGGTVAYQAPDRQWLAQQLNEHFSIPTLLLASWPDLMIQPLPPVPDLTILIGWTGSPASTDNLVQELQLQLGATDEFYDNFLTEARRIVKQFIDAYVHQNTLRIAYHYREYHRLLQSLAAHYHLNIETPQLEKLINVAEKHAFTAKSSGAGGGDCGIALGTAQLDTAAIIAEWEANQIQHLDIQALDSIYLQEGGLHD